MGKDYTLHGPGKIDEVGLEPFIEVKLGGNSVMTPDLLAHELELRGHIVTEGARDLMHQEAFTVHLDEESVSLCLITPHSLGIQGKVTIGDFYAEMEALKVQKCLPDMGPFARIHFAHQPPWSNVHLYMEPILSSNGNPAVFTLSRRFKNGVGDFKEVESYLDVVERDEHYIMPNTFQWLAVLPENWALPH